MCLDHRLSPKMIRAAVNNFFLTLLPIVDAQMTRRRVSQDWAFNNLMKMHDGWHWHLHDSAKSFRAEQ